MNTERVLPYNSLPALLKQAWQSYRICTAVVFKRERERKREGKRMSEMGLFFSTALEKADEVMGRSTLTASLQAAFQEKVTGFHCQESERGRRMRL